MINPNPAKVEDILNSSIQFEVPRYQREYKWGRSEAVEFIEDVKSYAEADNGSLFLGTVIFDVSEAANKLYRIVDGQQRITTIIVLLIACRNVAKKINAVNLANLIQNKISFTDPTTAESLGCRLIASDSIRDVLEHIVKYEWDGEFPIKVGGKQVKRQVNRLKPIYDYFTSEIKSFDQPALSKFLRAVYNTYAVRIDIQDDMEAFSIFERTNARGIDLEASDLLKNYLFSQGVEGIEEAWTRIISNSDGTALRMLKYFYVSRKGYITKSDLYKNLKSYGFEIGPKNLAAELESFSIFYSMIRSSNSEEVRGYLGEIGCKSISTDKHKHDQLYSAVEGLRLFKISQAYPVIYSALTCFVNCGLGESNKLSKKLVELFEMLEKYHFINNAICERIGNEVEKLYADFCKKYSVSSDFESTTKEFFSALTNQVASKEEFVSRFSDLSYSADNVGLISYIFDRINNVNLSPGSKVRIFNPDQKLLRKNHSIEHFYPQNPTDVPALPADVVNNIGNLLAVCFTTNSRLGNLRPELKMEKLTGELEKEVQNLGFVRDFIASYKDSVSEWGESVIAQRAKSIAELAYDGIWALPKT